MLLPNEVLTIECVCACREQRYGGLGGVEQRLWGLGLVFRVQRFEMGERVVY